jgi:hypothetical protein
MLYQTSCRLCLEGKDGRSTQFNTAIACCLKHTLQNGAGLLVVSDWYGRDGRGDGGHYHAPSAQGSQGWYSHTAHPGPTGISARLNYI